MGARAVELGAVGAVRLARRLSARGGFFVVEDANLGVVGLDFVTSLERTPSVGFGFLTTHGGYELLGAFV